MSAFKALKDVSNNFENELRRVSADLFCAKIGESFEDVVAKKLRDLSLFTSKVRLLRAKPISLVPQIAEQERDEDTTLSDYGELATWKIVEQQVTKSLTQGHAVKTLVTSSSNTLHPELVERKEKIIKLLSDYKNQEAILQHLGTLLKEKEDELAAVRARWDEEVGQLRVMRSNSNGVEEVDSTGPLYNKLRVLVEKLELMRWLIAKLVMPRTRGYDWLGDPHRRINALKLARAPCALESFVTTP